MEFICMSKVFEEEGGYRGVIWDPDFKCIHKTAVCKTPEQAEELTRTWSSRFAAGVKK